MRLDLKIQEKSLDKMKRVSSQTGNYFFKVNNETLEKGVKYVKS